MPSILNLKFKGNKSFVAFSNLHDTEALSQTWKVCSKVASYLEQGSRLENLSWRLWHLQNLMVDTDNAKSKREFKKLSKCMGDKLDKEKGRSIEELEAPDFRRTSSTELIRQRAAEKERYREQNSKPGTIKRMQFTFSVDQPHSPGANLPVKKPDLKPSPEFTKRTRAATRAHADDIAHHSAAAAAQSAAKNSDAMVIVEDDADDKDASNEQSNSNFISSSSTASRSSQSQSLKFDSIFNQGFGPSALLFPAPTLTTSMNYGEGLNPSNATSDVFSISRPTIELPLDEILNHVDSPPTLTFEHRDNDTQQSAPRSQKQSPPQSQPQPQPQPQPQQQTQTQQQQDAVMKPVSSTIPHKRKTRKASAIPRGDSSEDEESSYIGPGLPPAMRMLKSSTVFGQSNKDNLPETVAPSKVNLLFNSTHTNRSHTPSTRPTLTVRTQTGAASRSSGPGATATSLNPSVLRNTSGNNAPGGVKAECSNCGATHTPLWRRGLNDELNCNACGLYCKLHKRPRPKSMRNNHGEGRTQVVPRQDPVDVMIPSAQTAQCYNCHTTATPLWRKDDEGKTVCNACGLYYKLHGSARPISMKSDVIRKRSRHDARRGSNANSNSVEDTPSASPGASRRTSPARDPSPTLAPDSSTQGMNTYEFTQEHITDAFGTQSELVGALGQDQTGSNLFQNTFQFQFPGPYHPDYLLQMYTAHAQAAASNTTGTTSASNSENISGYQSPNGAVDSASPVGSGNGNDSGVSDIDLPLFSPRSTKRRRLSTDSASDPPSSAVSYFSSDGYSSATSATSLSSRSSMDFSFTYSPTNGSPNGSCGNNGTGSSGPVLRGSGNTFWHPPMMPQTDEHTSSPRLCYPSMLPSASTGNTNNKNGSASPHCEVDSQGNVSVNGGESAGNGDDGTDGCAASGVEDSPMDYLHHPMSLASGLPDDDSLFSAYLHPPMALHEDSPAGGAIVV